MTPIDFLGYVAATLTTVAFIPQAWRVHRTRRTEDLSLPMFALFTLGIALWLAFGYCLHSGPVIYSNSLTLLLAGYILWMKLRLRRP